MARQLAETTVTLIRDYVKANIATTLASVRSYRNDARVSTEVPESFFIYPKPQGYRPPAVFVMCDGFDFKIGERKANHINASADIKVSILVQDRDMESLTYKAWRYQAALHQLLDETQLTSQDSKVRIIIMVTRETFSPVYVDTEAASGGAQFRKEVVLECDVTHIESF